MLLFTLVVASQKRKVVTEIAGAEPSPSPVESGQYVIINQTSRIINDKQMVCGVFSASIHG